MANRNINYTNVCTFKCRFCAFSKGPLSLNLRGAPYLLDLDEITGRVAEAEAAGATEVCLQGGIHPNFDGEYYLDVLGAVRAASERIHIHGFTALEVTEGARRSERAPGRLPAPAAGRRAQDPAGDGGRDPRRRGPRRPLPGQDQHRRVARGPPHRPLRSACAPTSPSCSAPSSSPVSWARHIVRTRALQRETGGFTEFVPLPFVHMATPIYLQRRSRAGPPSARPLLMHAVGRIAYRGAIDNIQVSWVKMGADGARQCLQAGVNDLGGTLMDENISRAAGASHGQGMGAERLRPPWWPRWAGPWSSAPPSTAAVRGDRPAPARRAPAAAVERPGTPSAGR